MASVSSFRASNLARRLIALAVVVLVACTAGTPATVAADAKPASAVHEQPALGGLDQSSADKAGHAKLDTLPTGHAVPLARTTRVWFLDVAAGDACAHAARWLRSPAHEPPKTIRFCTLLN